MEEQTNAPEAGAQNNPGLVVPIDIEALCIGKNPGAIFAQAPFDFSQLKTPPYLSSAIATGGLSSMSQGVHLHWALADALSQGRQTGESLLFPAVPDRWLITRVFCNADGTDLPTFNRWIIESNYYAENDPNSNTTRTSVSVPFQGTDWENQPWRHLGKVSVFEDWLQANADFGTGAAATYLSGLTSVGYGQPDFAASYQNCQNILGFNDLGSDLAALGTSGTDLYLSYHIIGWYSNPAEDPIRQLPGLIPSDTFNDLLEKITDPDDKAFVSTNFEVTAYVLPTNVPPTTGQQLWNILKAGGYPLEIDIPDQITPGEFQSVLSNTSDPADKSTLETWYTPDMGPVDQISDSDKTRLWTIMAAAGFDFLGALLEKAQWALPSGTPAPVPAPGYTLYCGVISNVVYNDSTDYFQNNPANNFNIAIGNTPGEALSALIANTSGFPQDEVPDVELILDALQEGILDQVTDESMLADWEELKTDLHQDAFSAYLGGFLWEVKQTKDASGNSGEVTLPASTAKDLNDLNIVQQQLNEYATQIESVRAQIFADWYRFMQVYHQGDNDPSGGIQPGDLAQYITQKMSNLTDLIGQANPLNDQIAALETKLRAELGASYFLSQITAPRYWQPNDPALLFQGDGITPSDRFGNDGRYMYDNTLLCRLSNQLISALTIPSGAFGNPNALTLSSTNFLNSASTPLIPNPNNLPLINGINALIVDAALLNEDNLTAQLRAAGVSTAFSALVQSINPLLTAFLSPEIPQTVAQSIFEAYAAALCPADKSFLEGIYTLSGGNYLLNNPQDLSDSDTLRLRYIYNSVAYNPSQDKLAFTGLPFSEVGIQAWNDNPWLPFSLQWSVYFYPLESIQVGGSGYPGDFITSQFVIGDTDLDYSGPSLTPDPSGIHQYSNTIFLTPHAGINLQQQLSAFIDQHQDDPIKDELNTILAQMGDKPVLAQSLSGLNEALIMLHKEMQLPVADPAAQGNYYNFTNTSVNQAVEGQNTEMPQPYLSYNPIRAGLMKIANITLVDVFGRNVNVSQPTMIYRSENLKQTILQPEDDIYLPPRLTEPARLLFRWLSADDDTVEMNSHPAATPICGWILANHLDSSLWVYDNKGNPYGSLQLNSDQSKILWQCTPGSPYFGLSLTEFFAQLGAPNPHFEQFVKALYGAGDQDSADYLVAFMRALDQASVTTEPSNYKQYQANAVLVGRPYALTRASIDLELMGDPSYNQSWADLKYQVDQFVNEGNFIPGNDYGFTQVQFPVKIGNIVQTEDGLIGYFKEDDYSTFYAPGVSPATDHVLPPGNNNLTVTCAADAGKLVISMMIEPRGKIHASTGILPVKSIEIPPDQYVDALQRLQLSFLTAPVLTSVAALAMPVPAQTGGVWEWVENDGSSWSTQQKIAAVTVDAVLNYSPQQVLEGWLNLSSRLLTGANFALANQQAGKAVLYITNDPSLNVMSFSIINSTGIHLNLTGGPPVSGSYQAGGSSFLFNFGNILPDSILASLKVSATGWAASYFPATGNMAAVWSVAPSADLTLAENDSIDITITGITCQAGTQSGNFQIAYFNLPDIPDSIAPVLLPVAVQASPNA